MMDATNRIKNLSIALEALSRVNTSGSSLLFERIEDCLKDEIKVQEKETLERLKSARPAKPSTDDDDIPF